MSLTEPVVENLADEFITREIGEKYNITFEVWVEQIDYYRKIDGMVCKIKEELSEEAEGYVSFENFASKKIPVVYARLSQFMHTSRLTVEKLFRDAWTKKKVNEAVKIVMNRPRHVQIQG